MYLNNHWKSDFNNCSFYISETLIMEKGKYDTIIIKRDILI